MRAMHANRAVNLDLQYLVHRETHHATQDTGKFLLPPVIGYK